ncbi:MAG: homocysteine S-methyltransferase [Pseudomonadota bacterium]|nr:homocysteine S-methyltransferase [Pseudomonadota bacterium]
MSDPIQQFLGHQAFVVLDGALATELERRGADLRDPLWSAKCLIETPALIRDVHLTYFRAGADVATTASYQANFRAFEHRGIDHEEAARLMRAAVALASSARDEFWDTGSNRGGRLRPLVAASIGPYGATLGDGSEYRGHYSLDDQALAEFHRPRFRVLAESGADLLAFETIPCLREALVLARLLREFAPLRAWLAFSCRDGERNSEGEDVGSCVAALRGFEQIAAVGVNCTPPQYMTPLLRRMRAQTDAPLLIYPNSGEFYDAESKCWRAGHGALPFGGQARRWYGEGARLIGGCCRTSPDDIRGIRQSAALEH